MRRSRLLLVVCLALGATACGSTQENPGTAPGAIPSSSATPQDEAANKERSSPKNPAPEFSIMTFDGERFSLGEQRGTPVVLNFWESW